MDDKDDHQKRLTTIEDATNGLIKAWEKLPTGKYEGYLGIARVQDWIRTELRPAINAARNAVGFWNVTALTAPTLHASFLQIITDSGGHLIGTVYPGEKIDIETIKVPAAWGPLIQRADETLTSLRMQDQEEWLTFVIGEQSEQEAIFKKHGNLQEAKTLLTDFFNGWQPEDAPNPKQEKE
jgi:hypothetical protein